MDASKPIDAPRSEPSPNRKPASYACVGLLTGPILGLLFTFARIGPAGLVWWQGKGGETILTPLGRIFCSIIFAVGAFAGALCGLALEARYRPEIHAAKPKSDTPQEHLWDRELDG
jgi:hypothetical protein